MAMLWIGIHLPLLPLEAFAAGLPPPPQGVALVQAHRVWMADAQAQALGVRAGLKRATALALAPSLLLGQADAAREARALRALAHAALAFTPTVALDAAGHGLRLEVAACLRLFGGLPRLLQRLFAALQPLGHELRLATAPTALGASLLARWCGVADPARLGAAAGGPDALSTLRSQLDAAPLALLPAAQAQADALQAMGLRTLGDLRRLPRAGLARRLGTALLLELDRARGDAPDPQEAVELPLRFAERIELYMRADDVAHMAPGAHGLLRRLVAWAQGRHGRVAGCTLRLHHESHQRHDAEPTGDTDLALLLAEPSADAAHLRALLDERLARLVLPAPVLELSLHCDELAAAVDTTGELFISSRGRREGLARLLERLRARLGDARVRTPSLQADHRPEQALARPAFVLDGGAAAPADVPPAALARPVWLLPQPQPLLERAHQPWLDGGPLQLAAGPERLEAGWWDGSGAARDYFVAVAGDGTLVWVFRERLPPAEGGGWYLHGRFA